MRRVWCVAMAVAIWVPATVEGQASRALRFDAERVMNESGIGRAAHAELRAEFERMQSEIDRLAAGVRALRAHLDAMPEDDPRRPEGERLYLQLQARLAATYDRHRAELRERETEHVRRILRCADRHAEEVRRARGAPSIHRQDAPAEAEDATRDVIARLDEHGCDAFADR